MVYRFGPFLKIGHMTYDLVTRMTKSVNESKIAENQTVSNKVRKVYKAQLFDPEDEEKFPLSYYHIIGLNIFKYDLIFIIENLYRFGPFVQIWYGNQILKYVH